MGRSNYDEFVRQVVEHAASQPGISLRVDTACLLEKADKAQVADSTIAFHVDGANREDDCALIVSPSQYPEQVRQQVQRAAKARVLAGEGLETRICVPVLSGECGGRTYALYRKLDNFSGNRFLRRAQTMRAVPEIIGWLAAIFRATARDRSSPKDRETHALRHLRALVDDDDLSSRVRALADAAAEAVDSGDVRPVTCLEHGDLWTGNIMFERSRLPGIAPLLRSFRVIDWAGSRPNGFPGSDALRIVMTSFGSGRHARRLLRTYCRGTSLSPAELSLGCLCSVGSLSGQLNHFPRQRFNALAERTCLFLKESALIDDLRSPDLVATERSYPIRSGRNARDVKKLASQGSMKL